MGAQTVTSSSVTWRASLGGRRERGHQERGGETHAGRAAAETGTGMAPVGQGGYDTHRLGAFPPSQPRDAPPSGTGDAGPVLSPAMVSVPCPGCSRAPDSVSAQQGQTDGYVPARPKEGADAQCLRWPFLDTTMANPPLCPSPAPSRPLSRCHPCHPAAGAGRARGRTWPPSPLLSLRSLPLAPATRRETHGQQSALESPRLCRELCVGEGKAKPIPCRPLESPARVQPHGGHSHALCSWQRQRRGARSPKPAARTRGSRCSRGQPGHSRFLSLGAPTRLPPHVAGASLQPWWGLSTRQEQGSPGVLLALPPSASWAHGGDQPAGAGHRLLDAPASSRPPLTSTRSL